MYKVTTDPDDTILYPSRCHGFLNEWHADYRAARTSLERSGGYLLTYGTQFFIVQRDYIEALGLDPDDHRWERIGFDWAKPADESAWHALNTSLHTSLGDPR